MCMHVLCEEVVCPSVECVCMHIPTCGCIVGVL